MAQLASDVLVRMRVVGLLLAALAVADGARAEGELEALNNEDSSRAQIAVTISPHSAHTEARSTAPAQNP